MNPNAAEVLEVYCFEVSATFQDQDLFWPVPALGCFACAGRLEPFCSICCGGRFGLSLDLIGY